MIIFDNINYKVYDDLKKEIKKGTKIAISAAYFSIYAYQKLKEELEKIDEFKFIYTSPTFTKENSSKDKREFYIPRISREKSLHGTEFEVRLRNEMTQKSIAKECADWIRRKAKFKSNITNGTMNNFIYLDNENNCSYTPIQGFTLVDIGLEKGNNISNIVMKIENNDSKVFIDSFNEIWKDKDKVEDVTEEIIESISIAYQENSPEFIYFFTLYNIFNEFLEDISEDNLPNELTGFKDTVIWNMLYNFQQDAVLAVINKLEKYNGCILADSVGLGKTFSALAVMKYYQERGRNILVLCPKKLYGNWNTYKNNYKNNPLIKDRFRYDVLFHTDLSREKGYSNGTNLEEINWGNYDLVVIDESHNFRNGGQISGDDEKENRYLKLMNKVMKQGVKTKVLMLSATPVNNRFNDLKNQLALAYEGNNKEFEKKLNLNKDIDAIFKKAQQVFNEWGDLEAEERTTKNLLSKLDYDFFELLDNVTIARSRNHIKKYYNTEKIGNFPERLKPISIREKLTDLKGAVNYKEIYQTLNNLTLAVYTPSNYILMSALSKYDFEDNRKKKNLTQQGRETGVKRLMQKNLLKRLESSVYSFEITITKVKSYIDFIIDKINNLDKNSLLNFEDFNNDDFDLDDQNTDFFIIGKKVKFDLKDMDYISWKRELEEDSENLALLISMIKDIEPKYDNKLQKLLKLIDEKIKNPINENNKKVIIFTAFADTAKYLYDNIADYILKKYGLNTAMVTGSIDGKTTIKGLKADLDKVLTLFSPISKGKDINNEQEIDILIATDCISEGQNLQDCDYLINYDIHWNPVRIIQRFGRIDRIGSRNKVIQLVNYWPDINLDEYINLKARVESRMKISIMTSTGDDDLINQEEKGDLEYRRNQLKKLQEEVVDLEDINGGISIMDLGLNDFRLDLIAYLKDYKNPDKIPMGLHSVISKKDDLKPGVIFILKNLNKEIDINKQNYLHPFYMVYISNESEVLINHLAIKDLLDTLRFLCKNKKDTDKEAVKLFNKETKDGHKMNKYSELLSGTIKSIIEVKNENEIDAIISGKDFSFFAEQIDGLDDFELICFLVVEW